MNRDLPQPGIRESTTPVDVAPVPLPDLIDNSVREPASHFRWFIEPARSWLTALARVCFSYGDRDRAQRERIRKELSDLDLGGNEYAAPLVHRRALQGLLASIAADVKREETPRLAAAVIVVYLDQPVHSLLRSRVKNHEEFSKSSRGFREQVLIAKGFSAGARTNLQELADFPARGEKIGLEAPELALIRSKVSKSVGVDGMYLARIESVAGLEPDWTSKICDDARLRNAARLLRSTLLHPQTMEYGQFLEIIRPSGPRSPHCISESLSRCHIAGGAWWDAIGQDEWACRRAAALALLLADGVEPDAQWTKLFESIQANTTVGELYRSLARDHTIGTIRPLTREDIKALLDLSIQRNLGSSSINLDDARADLKRLMHTVGRGAGSTPAFPVTPRVTSQGVTDRPGTPRITKRPPAATKFRKGNHIDGCSGGKVCKIRLGWTNICMACKALGIPFDEKTLYRHRETNSNHPFGSRGRQVLIWDCALVEWLHREFGAVPPASPRST